MNRQIAVATSLTLMTIAAFVLSTVERPFRTSDIEALTESRYELRLFEEPAEHEPIRLTIENVGDPVNSLVDALEQKACAPCDVSRRDSRYRTSSSRLLPVNRRIPRSVLSLPGVKYQDIPSEIAVPMLQKSSPYYFMTAPAYLPGR